MEKKTDQTVDQTVDQPTSQATDQTVDQPTSQATDHPTRKRAPRKRGVFDYADYTLPKDSDDGGRRSVLRGVHYEGGRGYASDGFVLAEHPDPLAESREGLTLFPDGSAAGGNYPKVAPIRDFFNRTPFLVESAPASSFRFPSGRKTDGRSVTLLHGVPLRVSARAFASMCRWVSAMGYAPGEAVVMEAVATADLLNPAGRITRGGDALYFTLTDAGLAEAKGWKDVLSVPTETLSVVPSAMGEYDLPF